MNFETFLEDYEWFDKSAKPGTTYRNPVKRNAEWIKPQTISSSDKFHFMEILEDYDEDRNPEDSAKGALTRYKEANKTFPVLVDFVSKSTLNRSYTVFRAFGGKVDVTKLKPGSVIAPLPGKMMSTSLDWRIAYGFSGGKNAYKEGGKTHKWVVRIEMKAGQKGFYADAHETVYDNEKEILLPQSNLKVTGFSYADVGHEVIHTVDCTL